MNSFDKAWWSNLTKKSKGMKEPALIPNSFDKSFFSETDVLSMLRLMADVPRYQVNLRVYINQGLRHDWEIKVLQNPPTEEETIYQWVDRVFGNEKFCIAINNAEKFNDSLTQRCASFYKNHISENEIPGPGIDMGVFMGNYGYTPFGIHHDGNGVTILHCHLGPNSKDLYMWDNDWYRNHTGSSDSSFNPDELIPFAKKFTLVPYSIFFMPEKYHIGYNKEFSIDLTFGVSDISTSDLFNKSLVQSTKYLLKPKLLVERTIPVETIINDNFIADEFAGTTLEDYAKESIEDFKLSIRSNGGFECPPIEADITIDNNEIVCRKIKIKEPFRILFKNKRNQFLIIFIRRNRILVKFNKNIIILMEKINTGKELQVSDLLMQLKDNLSENSILTLIKTFAKLRAITID